MCRLYRNPKKTLLHSPAASSNAIKVHCNGIKASHNASKACKVITAQALLFWHKLCEGSPTHFRTEQRDSLFWPEASKGFVCA